MESKQESKIINRCAIVCGAPIKNYSWFSGEIADYDFIIAADSGYDHLIKIGVAPDILIGDLDSIDGAPSDIETIKYPKKKDITDFSASLKYCLQKGFNDVDVYAAWGNRAGHSVAAVFTMLQYSNKGMNIRIITENSIMFIVNRNCVIPRNEGYVSIFPLGDTATGVCLKGFEYPLNEYDFESCSPLGVSNRIIDDFGEISLKHGNLLVIIENL